MTSSSRTVDVVVIGGGVVGCSIFRELSRYDASLALIERHPDICEGTSKANSAIVHTGFDAPPGTLEARLLAEARELWPDVITDLNIPYLQTGAVMVATDDTEQAALHEEVIPKAEKNGVELQRLTGEEVRDMAPYVTERAREGVLIEGEGVIDPFWTTRAYAESAVRNGAEAFLGQEVVAIDIEPSKITLRTSAGLTIEAKVVVNAGGLWADEVARLAGDDSFRLTPRKGEFIITEDELNVSQIILPVPTKISKGILVTPIVFGGTLLGPTADDIEDKRDLGTTPDGLRRVRDGAAKLVPGAATASSIRQFAGLRAVSSTGEYIIGPSKVSRNLIHVAGIRSTGLSASPAIGRYAASLVRDTLGLSQRTVFHAALPEALSEEHADEGEVVCLCRSITKGEILAAMRSPLPPRSLDGLKRRTGAMLGDCQGNICAVRIAELFAKHLGRDPLSLEKHVAGSRLFVDGPDGDGSAGETRRGGARAAELAVTSE